MSDTPAVLRNVADRTIAAHRAVVDGTYTDEDVKIVAAWMLAKLNAWRACR